MHNKKILVTGSNGLLGQKLVYKLKDRQDIHLIATSKGENRILIKENYIYQPLDITNQQEVENVISTYLPDVIINTAAMTNVDACETQRELCRKLNVDAVAYLIDAIKKEQSKNSSYNCHFIHLSTDFIFDGEAGPYDENAKPNPISFYGQSKLDAETLVINSGLKWAIVRTIIVYGIVDGMSRSNVVLWAREALQKGQKINVVNDQFRTPTLAEDLADGCILITDKGATGIYHISGKDYMSILEIVERVADYFKLDKTLINPVSSTSLNQPAKRPPKTGFILNKAINELGYNPHSFEEGLKILETQLKKHEN
ncbi:MAG: SDR family oxidoreductase [Bacteroidia bacterium]